MSPDRKSRRKSGFAPGQGPDPGPGPEPVLDPGPAIVPGVVRSIVAIHPVTTGAERRNEASAGLHLPLHLQAHHLAQVQIHLALERPPRLGSVNEPCSASSPSPLIQHFLQ